MDTAKKYPEGTTHIHLKGEAAGFAKREADGWSLRDDSGNWIWCGEEVSGYFAGVETGIIWDRKHLQYPPLGNVLALVVSSYGGPFKGIAGAGHAGGAVIRHYITEEFVSAWTPTSGPINYVEQGKKIPVVFGCPTMQELYDGPRKVVRKAFPVRFESADDQEPKWLPVDSAPRDGRQLRLLVEFEENSTDDDLRGVTIGANYFEQNGLEDWIFAGWSWTQDCYTSGVGKVIGWLPLLTGDPKVSDPGFYGRMAARLRKRTADLRRSNDLAIKSLTATLESYERLSMSAYHAIIQAGGHCDHWRVMLLADLEYQDAKKALAELTGGDIS